MLVNNRIVDGCITLDTVMFPRSLVELYISDVRAWICYGLINSRLSKFFKLNLNNLGSLIITRWHRKNIFIMNINKNIKKLVNENNYIFTYNCTSYEDQNI